MSEPAEKFKIFVSSTTQDLKVHREQVRDLITAMGFVDIAMENWSADARPTLSTGSFREFALAKVMVEEFVGRRYDLLASRTQLDYVGGASTVFARSLLA